MRLLAALSLTWLTVLALAAPPTKPVAITGLAVSQGVAAQEGLLTAAGEVTVQFTLSAPAPVTIAAYSARPLGTGRRWYAHPATLCATRAVTGAAGTNRVTLPLAALKAPAAPLPDAKAGEAQAAPKADDPGGLPGDYVIEVSAGTAYASIATRLRAAGDSVPASRPGSGFLIGASRDSKGNILIADRQAWRGRRFSPTWLLEETFPKASMGHSSDPVECFDAVVDSKDNLYMVTVNGVYKYGPNGDPAPYTANEDYLKYPYPSTTKNLLGVRLDASAKGKKRYTFGPGGGGAGSKEYDAQEALKNPGFSFQWGGFAVDAQDNLYLASNNPTPEIQVFDNAGTFLRRLPLPPGRQPMAMRFGTDGALWLGCGGALVRLNAQTGAEEKVINGVDARVVHLGPDGTLYLVSGSRIWRFTPAGEPRLFTVQHPTIRDKGRSLNLSPREAKVPDGTAGYAMSISGIVGNADGSFDVLAASSGDPHNGARSIMHFAADGAFLPDTPAVAIFPHETGNIFLDDEPASVEVQLTNLTAQPAEVTLTATVRNLDGQVIAESTGTRTAPPLSSLTAPFALGAATAFGYYTMDVTASAGGTVLASRRLYGGRVADRDGVFHAYSPFGSVRMDGNAELLRRIGGGLNRGHSAVYWDDVETKPGAWTPFSSERLAFLRARALPTMTILGYGEPWDKGGFPRCRITSYDTFWQYCATVIRRHQGQPMLWQFWNEPNFFWHVPGPYQYEHYVMALKGTYAVAKALDPETPLICDGFAGEARGMQRFGEWGAGNYTDGVPIHYPGAKTISFDNMPLVGSVESKADMIRELAAIRDQYYPGRPLFNTEEGLWGMANRTPRDGAELLPRIYVSQLAAGIDRLTWFECFSKDDATYLLRGIQDGPWPAYFAYATASRFLEDAQYVGALADGLAQVHLFARYGQPVIVAWSMQGTREYTLPGTTTRLTLTDWQGNSRPRSGKAAQTLTLGPAVIYLTGMEAGVLLPQVAARQAQAAKDADLSAARAALATGKTKLTLNQLFHAARQEEVARLAPAKPFNYRKAVNTANAHLAQVVQALKVREVDGAYLHDTRVALAIARRTAYYMNQALAHGGEAYAGHLAGLLNTLADQVTLYLKSEIPWYPGVMLRVALDTTPIRQKTPAGQPLDEQFAPQVTKKAGDTVEIELTLYNWTSQPLTGTLAPVLPAGWQAQLATTPYTVAPGAFTRVTTTAVVPATTAPGLYPIGAQTRYKGTVQRELHTHRVKVE